MKQAMFDVENGFKSPSCKTSRPRVAKGTPLERGAACLPCRRKKMRCDGGRPICGQCGKARKPGRCTYEETIPKSRTQILREKLTSLEDKVRHLEVDGSEAKIVLNSDIWTIGTSPTVNINTASLPSSPGTNSPPSSSEPPGLGIPLLHPVHLISDLDDASYMGNWSTFDPPGLTAPNASSNTSIQETAEISAETVRLLLETFLSHRHQFASYIDVERFRDSLLHQIQDQPQAALVNAACLLGCYFSQSPHLTELTSYFLSKALESISCALENSTRLLLVIQASCLLSVFFFVHRRFLEGRYHSSCAARLALDLGLSHISLASLFRPFQDPTLSPYNVRAANKDEQGHTEECVVAYWQTVAINSGWSVVSNLSHTAVDVTAGGQQKSADNLPSFHGFVEFTASTLLHSDSLDWMRSQGRNWTSTHLYELVLHTKACILFERACRINYRASNSQDDRVVLEKDLGRFASSLPSLMGLDPTQNILGDLNPNILTVHTLLYGAYIYLYLHESLQPHEASLSASKSIAFILRFLDTKTYEYLDPVISICWMEATKVFIRQRALESAWVTMTPPHDEDLGILIMGLKQLGLFFPVAAHYAHTAETLRAESRA